MLFGAWMKDPQASSVTNDDKVWVTKDTDSKSLFEYKNKDDYRKNTQDYKQYTLSRPFHVSPSLYTGIGNREYKHGPSGHQLIISIVPILNFSPG